MAARTEEPPGLIELIQFYALRRDAMTLTIESAQLQRGFVSVVEGNVVGARTAGGKAGVDAFVEILAWDGPHVANLNADTDGEANVDLPLSQLLIEAYWKASEHEPSDPSQAPMAVGLDEETVAGTADLGPPDGVTKAVLETAQDLSTLSGFVAVALFTADGLVLETLGRRAELELPVWAPALANSIGSTTEYAVFLSPSYVDALLSVGTITYFVRLARAETNQRTLESELQQLGER